MCAEMRKSDDGVSLQKKGQKYLLWPFILLIGILIYTRNDPIDFMVRPSISYAPVGLPAAAVLLFIPTSLALWIREWRKINHNPRLNAVRSLALMLFMSALFAFLILRAVTQLLLDHAPNTSCTRTLSAFMKQDAAAVPHGFCGCPTAMKPMSAAQGRVSLYILARY